MSISACAALVREGDPDRFLATMAAPVPARAVLFPIYAFNLEVARAPWVSAEPMIGEMRLQWWRDVLEELEAGKPARAHDVVAALAEIAGQRRLPLSTLDALVEAHRINLYPEGFEDEDAFRAYIDATGAGLMWAAAAALGARSEHEATVRHHGWAAGLAAWLRAVPELEARGRKPLPDGRPEAVRAWAKEGLSRLRSAQGPVPKPVRPALLSGWRSRATLGRAAQQPGRVASGALDESEFARRFGLLRRSLLGGW